MGYGPNRRGSVGPKTANTRTPRAAARCIGPLSLLMTQSAFLTSAGRDTRLVLPVRFRNWAAGNAPLSGRGLLPAHTTFRDLSSLRMISVSCLNPPHFLSALL